MCSPSLFLLSMIGQQTFEGCLQDGADGVPTMGGGFGEFITVIVCNAADEVNGGCGRGERGELSGEWQDVATEELFEAVEQEGMNGGMFAMPCTEGTQRGQIAVGHGGAIDALDDVGLCFVGFLEEELADVVGQLPLENVTYKTLADVGSTAFITKNVAKCRNAWMQASAVVVAGVAACAENGDDACLMSAESSGGSEHVALDVDGGRVADDSPQGTRHNGTLLWCAACSVKMDG